MHLQKSISWIPNMAHISQTLHFNTLRHNILVLYSSSPTRKRRRIYHDWQMSTFLGWMSIFVPSLASISNTQEAKRHLFLCGAHMLA
ncbi:hypothetical protein DL98DRAFT_16787 [Cadophora sp. DSE1049]|nr:hypothetical protein DL98DRAFT_16787 [Cadophora sp. DSE1049]